MATGKRRVGKGIEAFAGATPERVRELEAALQADVARVRDDLFRGIDRLAQSQQVVVSALDSTREIMRIAETRTTAYEASPTVVPCPGCKTNRTVMVNSQKVRLHDGPDCPVLKEEQRR